MTPDDPRHGTTAGAQAHWRQNVPLCDSCRLAYNRARKRQRIDLERGRPRRTVLGERAHRIVEIHSHAYLAQLTGIESVKLAQYGLAGPDVRVLRSTRDRILAANPRWTTIGVQRRLQALAAVGYSTTMIAEAVGAWPSTIARMQRHAEFVCIDMAERVVDAYERLDHTQQSRPCASERARTRAAANDWPAPLAWDDIDNPDETPAREGDVVDEVVVERICSGRAAPATADERREVIRRWQAAGRSLNELERLTGWNIHRYLQEAAA